MKPLQVPKSPLGRRKSLYIKLGLGAVFVLLATLATVAQPPAVLLPVPPPPALNQIVTPDINKLGLLDCQGPAAGDRVQLAPGATMANCAQYMGFPITNPGKRDELVMLGKALFWDMRVGSDGVQACATCHFHAGADSRTVNQVSPGLNRFTATQTNLAAALKPTSAGMTAAADTTFYGGAAVAAAAATATQPAVIAQAAHAAVLPNGTLTPGYFPSRFNPRNTAGPAFGNNDVVSSQGVFKGDFVSVNSTRSDTGTYNATDSEGFNQSGHTVRRVEPRNTPTTIMAGFNLRNFWDGRANMYFNGVNPMGMLDPDIAAADQPQITNATSNTLAGAGTTLTAQQLMIPFSSLASQAVGPPGSPFEMSLNGRGLRNIGRKLLTLQAGGDVPLDGQKISPTDSVFAGHLRVDAMLVPTTGLDISYAQMIKDVFQPKFWNGPNTTAGLTLMEHNFPMFFGIAVQAYEATLVPDKAPLDPILAFMTPLVQAGATADAALTAAAGASLCTLPGQANCIDATGTTLTQGQVAPFTSALRIFLTPQSNCFVCHVGAEFTGATVSTLTGFGRPVAAPLAPGAVPEAIALVERMIMGDGNTGVYDSGFYNIGVRPSQEDLSIFMRSDKNRPFSVGMLAQDILRNDPTVTPVRNLLLSGNLKQPAAATGYPAFTVDLSPVPQTNFVVGCAPPAPNAVANGQVGGQGCAGLNANERLAIRGAFKTSTLRNTKFMGPHFHNGARASVRDVIAGHYNVGGLFNLAFNPQNCALKPNGTSNTKGCLVGQVDFDAGILNLGLTADQINAITALIEVGLTDDRVAKESGVFDHPQLCVPAGHDASGATLLAEVPEVGQGGNGADLITFEDQMAGNVGDAHTHKLTPGSCSMPAFSGGAQAHP